MVASTKKKYGRDALMSSFETISTRVPNRVLDSTPDVSVINPAFGVTVYKNLIKTPLCYEIITALNESLDGSDGYAWRAVEPDQTVRSAVDFSISEAVKETLTKSAKVLLKIDSVITSEIKRSVQDYAASWGINIDYFEPLNYVKYSHPHDYFEVHVDHSPNTVRTVSGVLYLNDNYDGGELHFPRLDGLTIKPGAGDFVVFPSTYLYEHESKPIRRGTKYSVVAFTDYKERI